MQIKKSKDLKLRLLYQKNELIKKVFKILLTTFSYNLKYSQENLCVENFKIFFRIYKKALKSSRTKIFNRCILTNRSRGLLRKYSISRIKMREMLQYGLLPGYSKAVW